MTGEALSAHVEMLIGMLSARSSRDTARSEIIRLGRAATPTLLRHADDPNPTIRWEMANVQGDIRDPRAVPALVERALAESDSHVRWRAMWAMSEYPDKSQASESLWREARSDDDERSWRAAVTLSLFLDARVLPRIHAALRHAERTRRWEAINALTRIHDETSAGHLAPFLDAPDVRERNETVLALGHVGGDAARDLLLQALEDETSGVRWRACLSLGMLGDSRARPALQRLQAEESDTEVLRHVGIALDKLATDVPEVPTVNDAATAGR